MKGFHSTVSRREFMKALGLGAAGLGVAAAAAPVFHDLDELSSSVYENQKRAWYVKDRDFLDPTTEIDWNTMKAWGWGLKEVGTDVCCPRHGQIVPYGVDDAGLQAILDQRSAANTVISDMQKAELNAGTEGYALRDVALGQGAGFLGFARGIDAAGIEGDRVSTPESLGVPKWTGTKEEATKMLRAAAHYYGAGNGGANELNEKTKRFFYPEKNRFEDVDQPYEDGGIGVLPEKCRWSFHLVVRQSAEMTKRGNTRQQMGATYGYAHGPIILSRMQRFIKGLGYIAPLRLGYHYTEAGMNVPMGVMAGLSETGRISHHITPEWGTAIRYTPGLTTDLPLAPTKPIDAGIFKFCETCKLCGDICIETNGASPISMETEPFWEVTGPWNRAGVKKWHHNWPRCSTRCVMCMGVCPFMTHNMSHIHELCKTIAATTPIFNSFFTNMEHTFGYGLHDSPEECEDWWNRDLRTWKYDTTLI